MSICYRPLGEIHLSALLDGRLAPYGIVEHLNSEGSRCLFDSLNYVHCWVQDDDVLLFKQYGGNKADYILDIISEMFGVRIVSEYRPEYWGFETQAEWNAALDAIQNEAEDKFYLELSRYIPPAR
jgi:hypothetical protein